MTRIRAARGLAVGVLLQALAASAAIAAPLAGPAAFAAELPAADPAAARPTTLASPDAAAIVAGAAPFDEAEVARLRERLRALNQQCACGEEKPSDDTIQEIESTFSALMERDPDRARVVNDLGGLYWRCVDRERISAAALRLLDSAPDPADLALKLAGEATTPAALELLLGALALRPDSAPLWLEAANHADRLDWRIAFTEQGVRCLLGQGTGVPASKQALLVASAVQEEVKLELEAGLLDRAALRIALLPDEARTILESGATGEVGARIDGTGLIGELHDIRLDLALLHLSQGDAAGAASLLAGASPDGPAPPAVASPLDASEDGGEQCPSGTAAAAGPEDQKTRESDESRKLWYGLLQAWSDPRPPDPFELLTEVIEGEPGRGRRIGAAAFARREAYPELAAHLEQVVAIELKQHLEQPVLTDRPDSARLAAPATAAKEIAALAAEIGAVASRLEENASETEQEARAALGPDRVAATVARLLRAPRLTPFVEHSLPPGVAAVGEEEDVRRLAEMKARVMPPSGYDLVRAEWSGRRAALIVISPDYDDVFWGAYWVILSADAGATWSRPLYTGLRYGEPYEVRQASNLPLFAGDRLRLEVELDLPETAAAADPETAPDPRPEQAVRHAYLEVPIAELERDSDGDGLTDLAEERLVTDPLDPDTDHDGISDGIDLLPQVAAAAPGRPRSRAAAANEALETLVESVGWPSERPEATRFWVGDRQLFAGVRRRHRIVVLTPEEMALAQEKFGTFKAYRLDLFVLDRAGHRAYAAWSTGSSGDTVRLWELDGTWWAKPASAERSSSLPD